MKRSRIVKLRLAPELLARFSNDSNKKRKLLGDSNDRPFKRQSFDPHNTTNGSSGSGGSKLDRPRERPKLIVKLKVGKGRLPANY
jgi:transcription initiation factor TFIID subunit 2